MEVDRYVARLQLRSAGCAQFSPCFAVAAHLDGQPRCIVARTIEGIEGCLALSTPEVEAHKRFLLLQNDDHWLAFFQALADVLHLVGTGGAEGLDVTIEPHLVARHRRCLLRRHTPHEFLHRLLGLNPRTSHGGIARGVVQTERDTQPPCLLTSMLYARSPFGRAIVHGSSLNAHPRIEDKGRLDACRLHILQILRDTLFRDVAVHPLPIASGHRLGLNREQRAI